MMNEIDQLASVSFTFHFEVINLVLQNLQRMNTFKTATRDTQELSMDQKFEMSAFFFQQ